MKVKNADTLIFNFGKLPTGIVKSAIFGFQTDLPLHQYYFNDSRIKSSFFEGEFEIANDIDHRYYKSSFYLNDSVLDFSHSRKQEHSENTITRLTKH